MVLASEDAVVRGFGSLHVADIVLFDVNLYPRKIARELIQIARWIVRCDRRCTVLADVHGFVCGEHERPGLVDPLLSDDRAVDQQGASAALGNEHPVSTT